MSYKNHADKMAASRRWKAANKDRVAKYQREWRKRNREHINAYMREYHRLNPEKRRQWEANTTRRQKSLNERAEFSAEIRQRELMKIDAYAEAKKALPAGLPAFVKDDVIADIVLSFLEGDINIDDIKLRSKEFLNKYNRMYDQWKTVSLDAIIPGTDGMTYMDGLAAT